MAGGRGFSGRGALVGGSWALWGALERSCAPLGVLGALLGALGCFLVDFGLIFGRFWLEFSTIFCDFSFFR